MGRLILTADVTQAGCFAGRKFLVNQSEQLLIEEPIDDDMCERLVATKFRPLRGYEVSGREIGCEKFVELQMSPANYLTIDIRRDHTGLRAPWFEIDRGHCRAPPIWQRVTNKPDDCPTIAPPQ